MTLIPWTNKHNEETSREFAPLVELRNEMGRVFDSFLRQPFFGAEGEGEWDLPLAWAPALDVADNEKEVTVRAEVPGVDPKELNISVLGNTLTLSGEKKESTEKREGAYYHRETQAGSFRRSVPLPAGVDAEKVKAEYANGVLTVHLPKAATAQPKRISIKTS
jgi:HSP20 family protein